MKNSRLLALHNVVRYLQLAEGIEMAVEFVRLGETMCQVYFPTTAIVSLLNVLADSGLTEINVVGK